VIEDRPGIEVEAMWRALRNLRPDLFEESEE
jgi:hypothetical protein